MEQNASISAPISKTTLIGQRVKKPDAPDKSTGKTRYINDMVLPQMLIGKVLFAGRPHARIVSIDTSAAEKLPGVHAVLTGKDAAGLKFGFVRDNVALKDKVRCEHDEIAAVAAETQDIALRALDLIEVEYEDLPGVFSPEAGAVEGAPLVHENFAGNRSLHFEFKHGDLAAAEALSDFVVDQRCAFHGARFGAKHTRQILELDFDEFKRAQGNLLRFRRHGCNLIVLAAHLVLERDVIADEAELESGGILASQHSMDARQLFCRRGVDAHDPGVRPSGEKDLADQHLRQHHVVDVTCFAG